MADNNEQDLEKIYEEYLALRKKEDEVWAQFVEWRSKLQEISGQIDALSDYKKPYTVRIYREIYMDVEMDAFNERDAEEAVLNAVDDFVFEEIEHFSSREPRVKVLCLSEDYKEEMEEKDE